MALLTEVLVVHPRSYKVGGKDEPANGTPAPMSIVIDGDTSDLNLLGSQHVGACLASICAMADADARGVTHLELNTDSEHLRKHATRQWRRDAPLLRTLHQAIEELYARFEDVTWT